MAPRPAELRPWLWPAAAAALLGLLFFSGRTLFWGDLTYIHHPWRALAAEQLARGRLPLYDPYLYLGMPSAAQMQGAAWYPGTLPFYFLPFEAALAVYHALHYGLAAFFVFLWLRRGGLPPAGALGGALVYAAGGVMASRAPFLNHLSVLAIAPALLLFTEAPWALGAAFALAFLSGYPLMLVGASLAAYAVSWIARGRPPAPARWAAAALLAAGLSAALLFPAAELARGSHRGVGVPLAEMLEFGMAPADLRGLVVPWLAPAGARAALFWWRACWLGAAAAAAAVAAIPRLRARAAAGFGAYVAIVLLLCLGGSTAPSRWLWAHLPPLRYVRYPGNMSYLLLPAAALLAAAGLRGRRAGAWVALIALELLTYASVSQPLVRRGFFTDAGPLARRLGGELGEHRYLLSPRALESHFGAGTDFQAASLDLKHRLYGLTNAPYHLAAIGNFGEPLVPESSYQVMDFLYSRGSLADAARYLPWVDGAVVLTREPLPGGPLEYSGQTLWHVYRASPAPSRARWLPPAAGAALPATLAGGPPPSLARTRELALERDGEDRFRVRGEGAGWLYLAEPRLPGWTAWVSGRRTPTLPALTAFQKIEVPAGRWEAAFRYRPDSWRTGLALTVLFLSASAGYWYNRLRNP